MTGPGPTGIQVDDEVADALAGQRPVVALESTIFSGFGLPNPANAECLDRCLAAVRAGGAVPAVTAVLDGVARVGIDLAEHERVLTADEKLGARDLGPAIAAGVAQGATTVSASLHLAGRVGIAVFATGGIGGVHRDVDASMDVSHDLLALREHGVLTVTAGAKAFLDLRRTLEYLETLGVPVLGLGTDELPAFWSRSSGERGLRRVDDAHEAARAVVAARSIGYAGGLVLACPIPAAQEIPAAELRPAIEAGLAEAADRGAVAGEVTPIVLAALAEHTEGRTVPANLALAEHNAAVAAEVAAVGGRVMSILHRSTVDRLPRPSIAERQRWAEHPAPSTAVHAEAVEALGVFDAVEGAPAAAPVEVDRLRIAAFNVERGRHADECADLLAAVDPDVVLLSEVDVGMARSRQCHVSERLADRLGMQGWFAVEFVELGPGSPEEAVRVGDETDTVGFHGGAVLSRVPVGEVAVLRLELDGGWYGPRPAGVPIEPRIGGRIAVLAVVECAGQEVVVAAPHLESHGGARGRADQLGAVLDAVDELRPGAPAVVGGDLNTTTLEPVHFADPVQLSAALEDGPERFLSPRGWEPLFDVTEERGYRWLAEGSGRGTARVAPDLPPTMRLDWFCVRGVTSEGHRVLPATDPEGRPVSDHELLVVDSVQPVAPRAS